MHDFYVDIDLIDPSPFAFLCPPDEENIQRMRDDLDAGGEIMTPLHAIEKDDGRWELLTGHDRLAAAKRYGLSKIPVSAMSVMTDEQKVSHLVRDNALRKTVSPRNAVGWFLREHSDWSNRRIAESCGCAEITVRRCRTSLEASGDLEVVFTRTDTLGREQPATKPRREADVIPLRTNKDGTIDKLGSLRAAREAAVETAAVHCTPEEPPPRSSKKCTAKSERAELKELRRKERFEHALGSVYGLVSAFYDQRIPDFTEEERRYHGSELKVQVRQLNALRRRILAGLDKDAEELEG